MRKLMLSISFLFALATVRASDTLTVRQIYNFDIGDTFDYKFQLTDYDNPWLSHIQYGRTVISQKALNATQDTLIYNGNWIITDLDSIAVYQVDTDLGLPSFVFGDTNTYPHVVSDQINIDLFERGYDYIYSEGLGTTYSESSWIDNSGFNFSSQYTQLIYYSKGANRWGTPYYILAAVDDIPALSDIHLFPNPASDILHLSFPDAGPYNFQFIIIDLLGQQVYTSTITRSETTHDISYLTSGLYTWRIISDNATIKTGKIIRQ